VLTTSDLKTRSVATDGHATYLDEGELRAASQQIGSSSADDATAKWDGSKNTMGRMSQ
jgi:hypothetical protein